MANVPIEMISKSVVHTSIKTTEIYLDSIEKKNQAQVARSLIPKLQMHQHPKIEIPEK